MSKPKIFKPEMFKPEMVRTESRKAEERGPQRSVGTLLWRTLHLVRALPPFVSLLRSDTELAKGSCSYSWVSFMTCSVALMPYYKR